MFGGPAWAFADAYSAHAPTHMYRFDHFGLSLRMLGLGATHGSEIVHVQHSYASFIGRKLHPLGRRLQPPVGRRMQRAWLDFAHGDRRRARPTGRCTRPSDRRTRLIMTARDVVAEDPDAVRRTAWAGVSASAIWPAVIARRSARRCSGAGCAGTAGTSKPITGRPANRPSRPATPLGFIAMIQVRWQPSGGGHDAVVLGEGGDRARRRFVEPERHPGERFPARRNSSSPVMPPRMSTVRVVPTPRGSGLVHVTLVIDAGPVRPRGLRRRAPRRAARV